MTNQKRNEFCTFFNEQNSVLKFLLVLLLLTVLFFFDIKRFLFLFISSVLYFLPCVKLLAEWLKLSMRLVPLFITLYLFVIIFGMDFIKESLLILKILYLLLISVYFSKTAKYDFIDIPILQTNRYLKDVYRFVYLVFSFVPLFIERIYRLKKKNLENVFDALIGVSDKIDIQNDLPQKKTKREFWSFSNLYLMLYFTMIFLLIEI